MTISPTATRVQNSTSPGVNEQIRRETLINYTHRAGKGPECVSARLQELDREWDIERTLQTNFAVVTLAGLTFGLLMGRKWRILPAVAAGFMMQHALKGWCPPVPVFRRLGYRTMDEINHERYALKELQ